MMEFHIHLDPSNILTICQKGIPKFHIQHHKNETNFRLPGLPDQECSLP